MNNLISEKLLSEVLGYPNDFDVFEYDEEIGMSIHVSTWLHDFNEDINIYELADKCKQWAFQQKRTLTVYWNYQGHKDVEISSEDLNATEIWVSADTEPEAAFKACQRILDNKDK